jgi:hypothetical protein
VLKTVLLDEIHVTVFARCGLSEKEHRAMCRSLRRRHFLEALRVAVRNIVRAYPSLRRATVKVSR